MKTINFLYIFVFVIILSISAYGQKKSISQEEYTTAVEKARDNTDEFNRKTVTVRTHYAGKTVTETEEIVIEFLPPNKSKWLVTETKGNGVTKTDIIYLGDIEYRRINGADWVRRDRNSGGGFGVTGTEVKNKKEYFAEEIEVGKERIKIFSIITIYDLGAASDYIEYKTYIDSKNLIQKITSIISRDAPANITSNEVTTYEYNPKSIKIEAPVIRKSKSKLTSKQKK